MRRLLGVLLVLVITLGCLPCPVWAAEADVKAPFSEDAAPTLCDTGRGYIAYSFYASAVYYSEDGVAWTDLSDRQWVQDARAYIALTSPMVHREFQFIWTGTEYMMRQDLRDDPRLTHQKFGDSPRNSVVTFLDEELQIIGQLPFDAPVSAIRFEDGTYYATVDGNETAFSREEWMARAPDRPEPEGPEGLTVWADKGLFALKKFLSAIQGAVPALRLCFSRVVNTVGGQYK